MTIKKLQNKILNNKISKVENFENENLEEENSENENLEQTLIVPKKKNPIIFDEEDEKFFQNIHWKEDDIIQPKITWDEYWKKQKELGSNEPFELLTDEYLYNNTHRHYKNDEIEETTTQILPNNNLCTTIQGIDMKLTGPIKFIPQQRNFEFVDLKLCFDHRNGEQLDTFQKRFLNTYHTKDGYRKYHLGVAIDYEESKNPNSKSFNYYLYRTDFIIQDFAENIAEELNGKFMKDILGERYFEHKNNIWYECKQKDIYKTLDYRIQNSLNNLKIGLTNKKLIEYIDDTIEMWETGNFLQSFSKEFIYENILGVLYSNNFNLFKNGEINLSGVNLQNSIKTFTSNLDYKEVINKFLKDNIIFTNNFNNLIMSSQLYDKYKIWCELNKYEIHDIRVFGKQIKNNGIQIKHTEYGNKYKGIKFIES